MSDAFLLGVDIGTYSSKGVLVNAESGEVTASHMIEHGLSMPKPGWVEMDADKIWWNEFIILCQYLLNEGGISEKDIKGVGISGIGPCVLPIDSEGKPLRAAILYGIDTRASEEIRQYEALLGKEKIFWLTGSNLSSSSTGPKILWLKNNEPRVFEKAECFLTSQSYLVLKLTGERCVDVYSGGTFAPFMDVEKMQWLDEELLGVKPKEVLPKVQWSCEVAGEISLSAAKETGLAVGTPVITGTIDAAAEAISTGLSAAGDMMMMLGSSNSLILRTEKFVRTQNFWGLNWLEPDTYAVVGGMSTVGSLTRWFRDNFAPEELNTQGTSGANAYAALAGLVGQSTTGANGLIALPYFEGERTPIYDADACGVLFGLNLKHTRADMYRALLEGVGYGIKHNLDVMESEGMRPSRILGVGGATLNLAWMQIIADIANISIEIPEKQLGASYGDAFMAGVGVGLMPGLGEIGRWVRHKQVITPSGEMHERYDPYYRIYRELYLKTKGLMHELTGLRKG